VQPFLFLGWLPTQWGYAARRVSNATLLSFAVRKLDNPVTRRRA